MELVQDEGAWALELGEVTSGREEDGASENTGWNRRGPEARAEVRREERRALWTPFMMVWSQPSRPTSIWFGATVPGAPRPTPDGRGSWVVIRGALENQDASRCFRPAPHRKLNFQGLLNFEVSRRPFLVALSVDTASNPQNECKTKSGRTRSCANCRLEGLDSATRASVCLFGWWKAERVIPVGCTQCEEDLTILYKVRMACTSLNMRVTHPVRIEEAFPPPRSLRGPPYQTHAHSWATVPLIAMMVEETLCCHWMRAYYGPTRLPIWVTQWMKGE